MNVLILGGTTFLGRHLVAALLRSGHRVATFTRGSTPYDDDERVTRYLGDRATIARSIPSEGWNAVIDTSGYVPEIVAASCAHLASAGRYVFASSVSVYDIAAPETGDGLAPFVPSEPSLASDDPANYGSAKRRSEDVVRAVFEDRATCMRLGLLVGPYDPTNRFTYWIDRFADGGDVAVPGPPERTVQFIDARDAAAFMNLAIENGLGGVHDVNGMPRALSMRSFCETARELLGSATARVRWIDEDVLAAHGYTGWMDLPLWLPSGRAPGIMNQRIDRALADGLRLRPLTETVLDTRRWSATMPAPDVTDPEIAGIARDAEAMLVAAAMTDRSEAS